MATWTVTFTVRDEKNQTSRVQLYLPYGPITQPQDDPVEFAQEFATRLDSVISGRVEAINLTLSADLPAGIKAAPTLDSDVEEGALFIYRTAGGYTVKQRIPTILESMINPGGGADFIGSVDLADLSTMMTQPGDLPSNWTIGPTDYRGDDIVARVDAYEDFKRSRP